MRRKALFTQLKEDAAVIAGSSDRYSRVFYQSISDFFSERFPFAVYSRISLLPPIFSFT